MDKQKSYNNYRCNKFVINSTVVKHWGALSTVLELLAADGINMRKLESRPLHGQLGKYVFFADVESDLDHPRHADLLRRLGHACTSFRILGSYPTGPQLDRMNLDSGAHDDEEGI